MRAGRSALAAALLGVVLSGCGGTNIGPGVENEPGPAQIVETWTSCAKAAPHAGGVLSLPNTQTPTPAEPEPRIGRIDPAFSPVAAVICGRQIRPGPNGGQEQVATERRAEEIAALLAALRLPNQRARGENICTLDMVVPPWLALVDDRGRWLRPYLPTTSCGRPRPEVLAALDGSQWTTVDTRTVGPVGSPAAEAAGCAQRWADMVWVETTNGRPATPGPAIPPAAGPMRLCVYQVPASQQGGGKPAGDFVYGGPLPAERQAGVLRALANRRAVVDCATPASRFAVLRPLDGAGPERYVELDGCRRFLIVPTTGGAQLGQGDDILATLLGPI
ncbi:hypothetical protein [Micromonospora parathelypteridis]|uniref:Uncharacterized protein n=1 Tax=Micromonospora parathelypteridis TaxID=1839617 RepID=A0A840VJT6_9ACTN|nr:hypothetical protein [Micromonospora parathelypteridis]MBB5477132.1 hypothetical protein [Micromonospora parathelypteridis]GGO08340.1 hypothetical protein GCM10011576_13660 [Micromonospora parathelypteridis]